MWPSLDSDAPHIQFHVTQWIVLFTGERWHIMRSEPSVNVGPSEATLSFPPVKTANARFWRTGKLDNQEVFSSFSFGEIPARFSMFNNASTLRSSDHW